MGTKFIAESGYRYDVKTEIHIIQCASCAMAFGIPSDFERRRRDDHREFYCPNGHVNYYSQESELELAKRKLAHEADQRRWYSDQMVAARKDAEHQRRVAAAARGRVTRIKNRIAAGVCPSPGCKRSGLGTDVVAHIRSCHPGFVIDSDA